MEQLCRGQQIMVLDLRRYKIANGIIVVVLGIVILDKARQIKQKFRMSIFWATTIFCQTTIQKQILHNVRATQLMTT